MSSLAQRLSGSVWGFAISSGLLAMVPACSHFQTTVDSDSVMIESMTDCTAPTCPTKAKVCETPTVHALASDLDHLERMIDWYGSVTPKIPDVWGQARLTQYREEFEQEMRKDLSLFEVRLNGARDRLDQSLFTYAQAINLAAGGQVSIPESTPNSADCKENDSLSRVGLDATLKQAGLNIEPTIELAQKKRYLDFLNQLRRENEGSDTADAPGYQLNLIRIPVSVLPGKRTDNGHGAEITFTINPILGDDLLPTTFRRMVINDVANQLSFVLTATLQDQEIRRLFQQDFHRFVHILTIINDHLTLGRYDEARKARCSVIADNALCKSFNRAGQNYPMTLDAFNRFEEVICQYMNPDSSPCANLAANLLNTLDCEKKGSDSQTNKQEPLKVKPQF